MLLNLRFLVNKIERVLHASRERMWGHQDTLCRNGAVPGGTGLVDILYPTHCRDASTVWLFASSALVIE
jgi:hypothetical protein